MFYRIINDELRDYADYKYAEDCSETKICSMSEFEKNKDNYVIINNQIELLPNLDEVIKERRRIQFEKEFFNTNLGWIRRKVSMKDGSTKDFLADLLLSVKAGIELGQDVKIITYKTPQFENEFTLDYMESLQEVKSADMEFVKDCLSQTVSDFGL